jgi:hypothetical protein
LAWLALALAFLCTGFALGVAATIVGLVLIYRRFAKGCL